jgi:hypothetical protein
MSLEDQDRAVFHQIVCPAGQNYQDSLAHVASPFTEVKIVITTDDFEKLFPDGYR